VLRYWEDLKTVSTWTAKQDLLKQQPSSPTSCARSVVMSVMEAAASAPGTLPGDIREALSCGQLTKEGSEDVNGVNAIKLVSVLKAHTPKPGAGLAVTLWVDPASYLPVRYRVSSIRSVGAAPGFRPEATWDISWLPPTNANLANFRVPIPAGFTHQSFTNRSR
jgi:hypothetical protein